MYWKFNQSASPHIDVLLNNKDVSVYELLDEEDVIQECRVQNKKLIEFLSRPSVMEELISLTLDPPDNVEERSRYKYPNIACELLTCDVPAINERIAGNETLLEKLYSFLERDAPLNPLLASFFSKLLSVLITRKAEQNWYSYQFTCLQVLEFLKSKENCVDLLLKHLGTSAIMDLVLKLITQIEGLQMKQNFLSWFNDQNLVQNLVALLDPSVDSDRHGNASQLLCDVIKMLRENQTSTTDRAYFDPILDAIESPDTVTQLLDHMLGPEKCETAIVGGVSVLLALLDQGKESSSNGVGLGGVNTSPGDEGPCSDGERISKVILNTTNTIIPRLKDFHNLLLDPPHKPSIKTTAGVLDPPVGITRLQVAKLLAALVGTNNVSVNKELADLGTVEVLLDLFFKYTWNNFLHTQVEKCIAFALNSELTCTNSDDSQAYLLLSHVFVQCKLLQRILDAWEDNETKQSKPGGVRCGYMGHLIKIANHVAQHGEKEPLSSLLKQYVSPDIVAAWEKFVAGALAEINQTHRICMGGSHPGQSSSEDSNPEYPDIPFPPGIGFRQYADFEIPQVSSQFIENYNFQDDEFAAIEDTNQLKDDTDHQEDIFGKVHETQSLEKTDDDVWDDQEQELNFQSVIDSKASTWQNEDEGAGNSSDEDERGTIDGTEIVHMEIDSTDPWDVAYVKGSPNNAPFIEDMAAVPEDSVFFKDIAPVEDAANPWGNSGNSNSGGATASCAQGWADFGSAGFADFEANFGTSEVNEGHKFETDVQKPDDVGGNSHKSEYVTGIADKLGAMGINKLNEEQNTLEQNVCEPMGSISKSDDNANCSSSLENDPQLLMDNYRYIFLSAQGLMIGSTGCNSSSSNSSSTSSGTLLASPNNGSSSKQSAEEQHILLPDIGSLVAENGPVEAEKPVDVEVVAALPVPKVNDTSPPAEDTMTSNGPV